MIPHTLYVVATPIGNLEDISYRAVRVLGEVDLVAAEDTRTARTLLRHYGIQTPTVSYFKGNEAKRTEGLIERLAAGAAVALISESGVPGISDPGSRLIARCISAGIEVDVIPGANAALGALILSGLPCDRFCFVGFLPRSAKPRRQLLERLSFEMNTIIFYEAPGRVGRTLAELCTRWGDRPAALVRELTKMHQQVLREPLSALSARFSEHPPRGEVTLVVGGAEPQEGIPMADLQEEIRQRFDQGQSPREIADALSAHGRRKVYQSVLEIKRQRSKDSSDP